MIIMVQTSQTQIIVVIKSIICLLKNTYCAFTMVPDGTRTPWIQLYPIRMKIPALTDLAFH